MPEGEERDAADTPAEPPVEPKTPPPAEPSPPPPAAPPAATPAEDWETRFKYLFADFENYRKRTAREQGRLRDRVRAEFLGSLLPIHEAFERAHDAVARLPAGDPVRTGMDLLGKEWTALLEAEGVRPVARVGSRFRADEHEAVADAPVDAHHPDGTVVEIVQQGYAFPGGLLRPAKVVIAKRPAPPASEAQAAVAGTVPPADPATE